MQTTHTLARPVRRAFRVARAAALALVTPLFEKNPLKTAAFSRRYVPMVLSMSRVIVLLFALAMVRQVRHAGVAGWPEATLCIAVVLALPLLNALDRASPRETIAVAKSLFGKIGQGATRQIGSVYAGEPNKHDDHRDDGNADAREDT